MLVNVFKVYTTFSQAERELLKQQVMAKNLTYNAENKFEDASQLYVHKR